MTATKTTTVALSCKHDKILSRLTTQAQVSKKEYIEKSIEYMNKFGINPIEFDSPSDEMKKLIKKLDQVIAFSRVQERDILKPACTLILNNEKNITRQLDNLSDIATNEQIKSELNSLYTLLKANLKEIAEETTTQNELQKRSLIQLAQAIDEKGKLGLSTRLKDLFS